MSKPELHYIAIEGVIGVGKTTMTHMLANRINAKLVLEEFEDNPFLEKFYEDPVHYGFQTQVSFLMSRVRQQQKLRNYDLFHDYLISDYIFDKDRIFATINLKDEELELYETIASVLEKNIIAPDLVIYLQSSVDRLMENIQQRNRMNEYKITRKYLEELTEAYNYFFFRYQRSPVLIINSTEIDFVNDHTHFEELVEQILHRPHTGIEYYIPSGGK